MQTSFTSEFIQTKDGGRVDTILRKCVHCGFCNATCPTYQLTGDELDGPRGRIYLIKNYFESQSNLSDKLPDSNINLKHLDRCLTCMSCETTCPSGVKYGELIDLGRKHIDSNTKRNWLQTIKRKSIVFFFSKPKRAHVVFTIARLARPILPKRLARKIPNRSKSTTAKAVPNTHSKDQVDTCMLTIKGCVQNSLAPEINQAMQKALHNSGIDLKESTSECCGALAFHLTDLDKAHRSIRDNIDEWHEKLKTGISNIVVNSSGCSTFIKQYGIIMQDDPSYAEKAKYVSDHCLDLSEIAPSIHTNTDDKKQSIAFHSPCTLQHGQKITGVIEDALRKAGYSLHEVEDSHICCGSAGSYSLLEKELSTQLLKNKVHHLEKNQPDLIVTANIGCLVQLQSGTDIPVKHWIELLN